MSDRAPPVPFLGMPVPTEPTPWTEAHIWSMGKHEMHHALSAILRHLDVTLKGRWNPEGGTEYRCFPKEPVDG